MIDRRSAIKYLCTLTVAFAGSRSWRGAGSVSFYVAGARYFPKQRLAAGDSVVLRPVAVDGHNACRVETIEGNALGFVPKGLLRQVGSAQRGRVETVALDGVPWRWYRISIA